MRHYATRSAQSHPMQSRCPTYDVVKQITILAQLTDEHARDLTVVFGDTDTALYHQRLDHRSSSTVTYKFDNVGMTKLGQKLQLADIHCTSQPYR